MFKRTGWYWFRLAVVVIAVSCLLYALFVLFMERSRTCFANGFNREQFKKLPLGVTSDAALKLLGQPQSKQEIELPETWLYCLPTLCPRADDPILGGTAPVIQFDRNGRTMTANDPNTDVFQPLLEGATPLGHTPLQAAGIGFQRQATREQVRESVGPPIAMIPRQRAEWWYYSGPAEKGNLNYEAWDVLIGTNGRVIAKARWRVYD